MSGVRSNGRSPSTMWRSVRQIAHAVTINNTSPGPGSGIGNRRRSSGRSEMGAWAGRTIALMLDAAAGRTSGGRRGGFAGPREDLERASEVGGVHHLALERERVRAAGSGLGKRRDELTRFVHDGGR